MITRKKLEYDNRKNRHISYIFYGYINVYFKKYILSSIDLSLRKFTIENKSY